MLTCLAFMLDVSLADLPALAFEVEAEARALSAYTQVTPALIADLGEFASDAERLAAGLSRAGVQQDLPPIFHDIAKDARDRAADLLAAAAAAEEDAAFASLRALLDDAVLMAPMAASAAADLAQSRTMAQR